MGSPEQDDDDTQKIDSPFFHGDGADDFPYLTNTMPGDDTFLLDDAFETQLVDLSGETRVVELHDETQVIDDLDFFKSLPVDMFNDCDAEVFAGSESEGTNKNEILCDTKEVSRNDPVNIDGGDSIGRGKGSLCGGFTAIRAASIRASGIAARARGANGNLCVTKSDESSMGQRIIEQVSSSCVGDVSKSCMTNNEKPMRNEYNEDKEEPRNTNSCKAGAKVARKLFMDEQVTEVDESEAEMKDGDGNIKIPEFLNSEKCLVGLSYANSQQPGELSQADALEFVDRFVELNSMDYDQGFHSRVRIAEKAKVVSGAKGSRDLAKSFSLKSTVGLCGVYDWDDSREDEGGGDFLRKNKELFFSTGDLKPRSKAKSLYPGRKLFHKNLAKNFDEQRNLASECRSPNTSEDIRDMENVGPDTQIAAEAMETLCNDGATRLEQSLTNPVSVGVVTRRAKQKRISASTCNEPSSKKLGKRKRLADQKNGDLVYEKERISTQPSNDDQKKRRAGIRSNIHEIGPHRVAKLVSRVSKKKSCLQEKIVSSVPVAYRTRKRKMNCSEVAGENMSDLKNAPDCEKKTTAAKNKNAQTITIEKIRKLRSTGFKQSVASDHFDEEFAGSTETNGRLEVLPKERSGTSFSTCTNPARCSAPVNNKKGCLQAKNLSSVPVAHRTRKCTKLNHSEVAGENMNDLIYAPDCKRRRTAAKNKNAETVTIEKLRKLRSTGFKQSLASDQFDEKSAASTETNGRLEALPKERSGTSFSTCITPARCLTPENNGSPVCMGDEYHSQTCRENNSRFSLKKEVNKLSNGSPESFVEMKESRKRRQVTDIRVLFSQHLNVDVIKQQKKILARLGAAVASSMSDATHFVADEFVRTRNMLEAIACGKPVVTHLWLESCGQASCLVDEKNYILSDVRKEKKFSFSMAVSLSRSCQHPLLQGQRVLVTPNTKPGKETLTNLIKAVHGLAVERLGKSVFKNEKLPDDLLVLSCEEDYDICVPFLEKGGAVYSSELLLNGIVKQKLEYERHRLFADHVKSTRSTIWVKKKNQYIPATKCK